MKRWLWLVLVLCAGNAWATCFSKQMAAQGLVAGALGTPATYYICNVYAERPVTGLNIGDTLYAIDTATSYIATGSTAWATLPTVDKGGQVFNVKAYGALVNGVTDDLAAFNATATAAKAVGGTIYVPQGTAVLSGAFTLPSTTPLVGAGMLATILQFTGATDGIVLSDTYAQFAVRELTVSTTNASGGKAINVSNKSFGASKSLVERVTINATGSGFWAYGLWGNSFQTSVIDALIVNNAAIGIHCEYGCNALNFYGVQVVGGTGVNRAVELQAASGSGGSIVFEQYWYGCTLQGAFAQSALNTTGMNIKVFGMHVENTNGAPSDGADVIINGTSVSTELFGMQGGSILTAGTIRNLNILGGEVGVVTIAAGAVAASVIGVRATSLTDNGQQTTVLNFSDTTGAQLSNKIVGPLLAANSTTFPAVGTLSPSAFLTVGNGSTFEARDAGGTTQSIMLPLTAADDTYVQYKTGHSLNLRSTAGGAAQLRIEEGRVLATQPIQLSAADTGLWRNAAGVVEANNGTAGTLRDIVARGVGVGVAPNGQNVITFTNFLFANIATALTANGQIGYCSDCTIANPCAGSGTGAIAKRLNGVNVCN